VSVDAHQRVFRHEAFFYADEGELMAGLTLFVRDGLAAGEPTPAVLSARRSSGWWR
jgi:hypothetical protein